MAIYVKGAGGSRKKVAGIGLPGPAGKSAYQYAVDGGFTGTEEQFAELQMGRSNLNLLDNWYFPDPINQRGQTEYTAAGYMIDRWMLGGGGASVSLVSDGLQFTSASGEMPQRLDCAWEDIAGKTFTVSFLTADNKLAFASGTIPQDKPEVTTNYIYASSSVTFRMSYSVPTKIPYVSFVWSQANTTPVVAAKLELGSVQTLAHQDKDGNWVLNDPPPNRALELAKCQRYQISPLLSAPSYTYTFTGQAISETRAFISIPTPVTMRATPTISYENLSITGANGTNRPIIGINLVKISQSTIFLDCEVASGLVTGNATMLYMTNNGTGKLFLDANL